VHRNDLKTTQHTCWGVPLICNYKMSNTIVIEKRPLGRLTPYLGNARTHSDEQITQIAASIAEFGFINPILIGDDGVIIAGHGRLAAAKSLGMIEVPVIVLDHLTEAQRRALVIADNRIARTPVGMRTCCVPNSRRYATKISSFSWLGLPKPSLESYSTASTLMQVPRAHRQSPIRPKKLQRRRRSPNASEFRPSRSSMHAKAGGRTASVPGSTLGDPETAIVYLRKGAEAVAKDLYRRLGCEEGRLGK
jgi:hypothetical protein